MTASCRLGAIDIGSNSIHVNVVEPRPTGGYSVVENNKWMIKLGAGTFTDNELPPRAFQAGLEVAEETRRLLEGHGVTEVVAVATSAVREAKNGRAFLKAWRERTGLQPRIISGREEARLIARAVTEALPLAEGHALVIDIGGGSTELAITGLDGATWSLPLGVQRLRSRVGHGDALADDERAALHAQIRGIVNQAVARARAEGVTVAVGTSGTLKALGELVLDERDGPTPKHLTGATVSVDELAELTDELCGLTEKKRKKRGVDERRADSIHLGALVALTTLRGAGIEQLLLCEDALREGLIHEHLAPAARSVDPDAPLRQRAVRELMRRSAVDEPRADHVASLAAQIFQGTRHLHGLGPNELELLEGAARLHTAGQWLNHHRYHRHSRYLVWNAELRGYSPRERLVMGHVARYHRKKPPKRKHKKLSRLETLDQDLVMVLAGMLRLAVAFDRCHNQAVTRVEIDDDGQTLTFTLHANAPPRLEIETAERRCDALERALARDVSLSASIAATPIAA